MAVPYGRKSRAKSRMHRAATMKYAPKTWAACPHCSEPKMPHFACGSCGAYKNRQARALAAE